MDAGGGGGGREERGGDREAQHCRQIPGWWWGAGLAASTAVCTAVLAPMFRLPLWQPPVAVLVAGLVGVPCLPPHPPPFSYPRPTLRPFQFPTLLSKHCVMLACRGFQRKYKHAISIIFPFAVVNMT